MIKSTNGKAFNLEEVEARFDTILGDFYRFTYKAGKLNDEKGLTEISEKTERAIIALMDERQAAAIAEIKRKDLEILSYRSILHHLAGFLEKIAPKKTEMIDNALAKWRSK